MRSWLAQDLHLGPLAYIHQPWRISPLTDCDLKFSRILSKRLFFARQLMSSSLDHAKYGWSKVSIVPVDVVVDKLD